MVTLELSGSGSGSLLTQRSPQRRGVSRGSEPGPQQLSSPPGVGSTGFH